MLDDGDSGGAGRVELADQFEGGVGVVDVVVGKLLALKLARRGDAWPLVAIDVEAGVLMRVLAIAHHLLQPAAEGAPGRMLDLEHLGEPAGDRRIVGGGAGEGLGRQLLAEIQRQRAEIHLQRIEHRG